jgi:hypothetical protein
MPDHLLPTALAAPSLLLGVGAFLRHVPGEWSRAALLAWAAVLLARLMGSAPPAAASWSGVLGLAIAFAALVLGGAAGLGLLALAFALLAAAGLAGIPAPPWGLCLATAVATAAATWREAVA